MATQEDLHVYLINATACLNPDRNSKMTRLFMHASDFKQFCKHFLHICTKWSM